MTDANERFDLVSSTVESLTEIAGRMIEIGVYDHDEHTALELLVNSLSRAMKVLDPDRYREYVTKLIDEAREYHAKKDSEGTPVDQVRPIGQYL